MTEVTGYSRAQIAIHWGVVLLLIVSFFSREGMSEVFRATLQGKEVESAAIATLHRIVGIVIFLLALTRIGLRLKHGAPALPAGGKPLLDLVARITHIGLYALILVIPLTGLLTWFGLNRDIGEVHETLFALLVFFTGLHVVGALYHQFVLKDGLMERMRRPG